MKKIYISGKISGLDAGIAEEKFWQSESKIERFGIEVISPTYIKSLFGIDKWIFHILADIRVLLKCDAILLQPDWIDSRGSKIEVIVAILTGKKNNYRGERRASDCRVSRN